MADEAQSNETGEEPTEPTPGAVDGGAAPPEPPDPAPSDPSTSGPDAADPAPSAVDPADPDPAPAAPPAAAGSSADDPPPDAGPGGAEGPGLSEVLGRLDEVGGAVAALDERMAAVEAAVFAIGSTGPVLDALASVEQRVGEVARLGDHHNELIDKLHADNQALRKGELTQAVAPIFRDLIRLSDQLAQLDETSPEPGKGDAALAGRQVLEILARSGVRPEEVAEGAAFDSASHQGIGRRDTTDPEADGTVASVRRPGFVGPDGKLLRAAEVEVWRYVAPAEAPAGEAPDELADQPADEPAAPAAAPAPVAVPPPAPDPDPSVDDPTPAAAPVADGDTEGDS